MIFPQVALTSRQVGKMPGYDTFSVDLVILSVGSHIVHSADRWARSIC
jgi:hypothetical protein